MCCFNLLRELSSRPQFLSGEYLNKVEKLSEKLRPVRANDESSQWSRATPCVPQSLKTVLYPRSPPSCLPDLVRIRTQHFQTPKTRHRHWHQPILMSAMRSSRADVNGGISDGKFKCLMLKVISKWAMNQPINMGFIARSYWGGYYYYSYELSQLSRSSEIDSTGNQYVFFWWPNLQNSFVELSDEVGELSPIIVIGKFKVFFVTRVALWGLGDPHKLWVSTTCFMGARLLH